MTWKRGHNPDVLDEEHHRIYGSKWALGLDQLEFAIRCGLQPSHSLLDFGCGAGRAGVHLIAYLEPGRYVGVDGHAPSLGAFENYEIPLHRLARREPRLVLHDATAAALPFADASFDMVLAFSVFNHIKGAPHVAADVARVLRPGGTLVAAMGPPPQPGSLGLALVEQLDEQSRLVADKTITWFVYRKEPEAR
jgi:SAM-dependent methyltransferase